MTARSVAMRRRASSGRRGWGRPFSEVVVEVEEAGDGVDEHGGARRAGVEEVEEAFVAAAGVVDDQAVLFSALAEDGALDLAAAGAGGARGDGEVVQEAAPRLRAGEGDGGREELVQQARVGELRERLVAVDGDGGGGEEDALGLGQHAHAPAGVGCLRTDGVVVPSARRAAKRAPSSEVAASSIRGPAASESRTGMKASPSSVGMGPMMER
ncbi:MAG: hypothetical protein AB1730_20780 [Myxococcota bacterium]